jgi:two-component system cell cycle sensor histidine kinase/response regulator CckA
MLLDQVRDAVTVTDLDGRVLYWNEAASRLYGFSAEEMVGQPLVCRFPPPVQPEVERVLREIAAGADWSGEYEDYRKDGSRVWVDLRISRIADAQGRPVGLLGLARDISQRRLLQAQLWQAQKMEAVGQLAGGIAHDFNNLLTIINGYSEMVLEALPAHEPLRELVAEIKTAGERSAVLTRQLLAFSRKQVLAPQRIDLNQVVRDTEKLLRRAVGESVNVVLRLAEGLPPIKADPGQIEQVLLNLAVNARDAMPHGGELVIETQPVGPSPDSQAPRSSAVLLSVRDTGCGMSEEVQTHIFEPFFTTKEPGKGTGLGLSVVHGIVQQSGGWIGVQSTPGLGTTFWIRFPASAEAASAGLPPSSTAERDGAGGSEIILVVEDEPAVRRMSAGALQKKGYRVLTADGPAQAVHVCQCHGSAIDLMLTDLVMPELNGRRLAELLGRMAVGYWEDWDEIDFPPPELLRRLRVDALAAVVEQARSELAQLPGAARSVRKCRPSAASARLPTTPLPYFKLGVEPHDLLATLLEALKVPLARTPREVINQPRPSLVNCLDVSAERFEWFLDDCIPDSRRVLVANSPLPPHCESWGPVVQPPCSYRVLCDAVATAASAA